MSAILLRQTLTIIAKDLRREWRTREILTSTIAFAVLLMVIFAFGFYRDASVAETVFPGTLWSAVVFTGTLAIGRTFQQENQGGSLRAMALIPGSELSLYLGKALVNLVFMLLFELALFPLLVLAFSVDLGQALGLHLLALFAGTVGFAALGTLVSAMLVKSELREVLLPIVLYPLLVPLFIAGVVVTSNLLEGSNTGEVTAWIQAMFAMDLVYAAVSVMLFRWVLSAIE